MRAQAKCQRLVVSEDDDITTFNKMLEMFYGDEVDGQKLSAESAIARLCRLQLLSEEGEWLSTILHFLMENSTNSCF